MRTQAPNNNIAPKKSTLCSEANDIFFWASCSCPGNAFGKKRNSTTIETVQRGTLRDLADDEINSTGSRLQQKYPPPSRIVINRSSHQWPESDRAHDDYHYHSHISGKFSRWHHVQEDHYNQGEDSRCADTLNAAEYNTAEC